MRGINNFKINKVFVVINDGVDCFCQNPDISYRINIRLRMLQCLLFLKVLVPEETLVAFNQNRLDYSIGRASSTYVNVKLNDLAPLIFLFLRSV